MVQGAALAVGRARARTWSAARWVEALPTWRVLATFVVLQWLLVLGIALVVRHNGWIYYQGGDQLWYSTTGWLLAHGHFPQPGVGYLWSVLLAPITLVTGANVADAYPAIIVVQFLFLLPLAPLAIYGIGRRIGGRLFGYWAVVVWLVVPLIGIKYTDAGYHQRFTEVLLPQGFGLTGMADFPTMVAALVAAYFCVRALVEDADVAFAAVAAGLAAGAAIAIKPATALFLAGPALAFLVARRWRAATAFAIALLPAVLALTFIKWRGFGYVPLFHASSGAVRVAAGTASPLVVGGLGHYISFDWQTFTSQLDQVREHFWSVRLVEWLVIGGALAICLRTRRIGALVVGWFAAIVFIKTGSGRGGMEGGNLLRLLMPAYPAFVLMLASLPFLWPRLARRLPEPAPARPATTRPLRLTLIAATILLTAVIPVVAYAAASPVVGPTPQAAFIQQPPIPIGQDLGLTGTVSGKAVHLTWTKQDAAGGRVFYHVFRSRSTERWVDCPRLAASGASRCQLNLDDLGTTRVPAFVDRGAAAGTWTYYVGVAANWSNDTTQGDVYVLSAGARARVP